MVEDLEVKLFDGILKIELGRNEKGCLSSITYPTNSVTEMPKILFHDNNMIDFGSSVYQKQGDLWVPFIEHLGLKYEEGSREYEGFDKIIFQAGQLQELFKQEKSSTLERYIINKDEGTVLDTHTGLIWDYDLTQKMGWDEAVKYAKDRGDGSSLPTGVQLKSLGDNEDRYPTSDELKDIGFKLPYTDFLPFWTSKDEEDYAWLVSFDDGRPFALDKTVACYAVCVRSNS